MEKSDLFCKTAILNKIAWVKILEDAGLDKAGRAIWHSKFERVAPQVHKDFLEPLGIPEDKVAEIRNWSSFT